jgi:hypothetical protein
MGGIAPSVEVDDQMRRLLDGVTLFEGPIDRLAGQFGTDLRRLLVAIARASTTPEACYATMRERLAETREKLRRREVTAYDGEAARRCAWAARRISRMMVDSGDGGPRLALVPSVEHELSRQ